jgi:biotin carboxyl carrier protein
LLDRIQKVVLVAAGLAAFALGGAALAGAASKSKAKTATTTQPKHGSAAHEDTEKPVTGDAAAQAQAAAEKSVGSGSKAGDVVSDFGGNGYEVTVTKADGSKVEVHLGKSFKVIQGGHGGRGGHHGFGGPEHGSASHEDAEKPVTGDAAAKAQAAAEKSVGSGSKAGAVVSDFGGNGYEITVAKSDGSKIEVHLDKSFNVVEGHGGHHGGRDGDGPDGDGPGGASFDGASSSGATTGA